MIAPKNIFRLLVLLGVLVNISAISADIMEPDGALYASIAKGMYNRGDLVNLFAHGTDWLDKPHFPFWMAAFSYALFGLSSFAYKLPALVFWGIGGWYCWEYALRWHGRTVAQVALLVYLTALHLVISNNDVRAEPYLTGMLMGAVYHYRKAMTQQWTEVIAGSAWLAAAVMTKGIFVLIPVIAGLLWFWWKGAGNSLIPEALHSGEPPSDGWQGVVHQLRRRRWWIGLLLVFICILPELYCLWVQFDAHPDKEVFGRQGVSGIQFFFWDSQWGRFFNNGPIRGQGEPFFYLHTLLWAFLPWSVWLYLALGQSIFKQRSLDALCAGVSISAFLLFSLSRFQLSHYLNMVFPFFAVLLAQWLVGMADNARVWRFAARAQVLVILVLLLACAVIWGLLSGGGYWWVLGWVLLGGGLVWLCFRGFLDSGLSAIHLPLERSRVLLSTYLAALTLYGFLNMFFHPVLLRYQAGTQAAFWLAANQPDEPVHLVEPVSYSLDFYATNTVYYTGFESLIIQARQKPQLVFSSPETFDSLQDRRCRVKVEKRFAFFPVSRLQMGFLLPSSRPEYVQERWLAWVSAPSFFQGPVAVASFQTRFYAPLHPTGETKPSLDPTGGVKISGQ